MKQSTDSLGLGRFYVMAAAMLALPVFLGCEKQEQAVQTEHAVPVHTVRATAQTVPLYIDTIGQTIAFNAVSIQPQVSGQLMQIHFKQGDMVKKGDLLYTIFQAPYQAELDAAKAQLLKDEADLAINEKQLERSKVLLPQKYVSEQAYEQYEANVKMLKAAIAADKARIEQAQVNLNYCSITAPVDGLIGIYQVNEGNIVQPGTVLTTIRQLNPLYADFVVPSAKFTQVRDYLGKSKTGDLDVSVAALTGEPRVRTAALRILGNQVSPMSGTVTLRAELENKDLLFWPNEQISARIILAQLDGTVLVPQASVRYNMQGSYVWTVVDGRAKQSFVDLGQLQADKQYGIVKGVADGDMVVTVGSIMLQPGSKVVLLDAQGKPAGAPAAQKPADSAQH